MARKTRQRISYVLPLASASSGHRLGVNGVCVDQTQSILYSAGRDGVILAWDLESQKVHDNSKRVVENNTNGHAKSARRTTYRRHVQAHTHWINDLLLTQGNQALVSASSDTSIKVWRPHATDVSPVQTIGQHSDYVKCLATPNSNSDWVAAGGLDRRIRLWDLNGKGLKSEIKVGEEENETKGSVYALAANDSLIASGGPECLVKIWDPRSTQCVTKFVGHTDNIRSILISDDSETIMTASSDRTIKLWSMTAGRCISTLGMHNDSVWCLYSNHPRLSIFYSGDKSGLVAKTDVRGISDLDDGLSLAILREQQGVCKITTTQDSLWIATSNSYINRWADIDTNCSVQIPDTIRNYRTSIASRSNRGILPSQTSNSGSSTGSSPPPDKIPFSCILRLPTSAGVAALSARVADRAVAQAVSSPRKASVFPVDSELGPFAPLRSIQEETIDGQNGLIKHVTLNNKRHVLTLDTAGEVTKWDLLKCIPVQFFGKRDLDDVVKEVNTAETVAQWCAVDTRTGTLTCVLEDNRCFDAEMYADQIEENTGLEFKDDQRINLGKWVLRYLFSNLIEEELVRDEAYREKLMGRNPNTSRNGQTHPRTSTAVPLQDSPYWSPAADGHLATNPRAGGGEGLALTTPGLSIGVASPGLGPVSPSSPVVGRLSSQLGDNSHIEQSAFAPRSQPRTSSDKPQDYFSAQPTTEEGDNTPEGQARTPMTPSEGNEGGPLTSTMENEKTPSKEPQSSIGKRLRIQFSGKRIGRAFLPETSKSPGNEEKSTNPDNAGVSRADEKTSESDIYQDKFLSTVQRIREEYDLVVQESNETIETLINPCPPNEAPPLQQPSATTIIVQEERPDSAGVADLFEGTLNTLGRQIDVIERIAPLWLGEFLLRNRTPPKEVVKISFTLEPYRNSLPFVTGNEGTERLNANRMLRAKKILAYIAERLEESPGESETDSLRPEEYLDLYCQNQLLSPSMTLATIRQHIWRGGGDVALVYRANGKKKISAGDQDPEERGVSIDSGAREV